MIWGIVRRKITSAQVIGQSVSKIGPRCRATAQKENHKCKGNYVCSTPRSEVIELIQKGSFIGSRSRLFSSDSGDLVDAVVPFMGESITDGTLAKFLKQPGDRVEIDEPIAQIETDKVTIDVASPQAGVIQKLIAKEGETVEPGAKIAVISKSGEGVAQAAPAEKAAAQPPPAEEKPSAEKQTPESEAAPAVKDKTPSEPPPTAKKPTSPPSKPMASEPQLPPKDRERRASFRFMQDRCSKASYCFLVPMTRLRKRVATRLKDSQNTFALLTTFNEVDMTNLMKLRSDYKDAFLEKHVVKLGLMSGFVKAAVSALQHQPVVNAVIDGDDIIYRDYIDISFAVGTKKTGFRITGYLDLGKLNSSSLAPPFRTQEYLLLCSEAKLNYSVVLAENLSYPLVLRSHKLDYQTISLMVLPKLTRKGFRWAPDQWASPLTMRGGLVVPVIRNSERMNFAEIEKEISTLAKKANDGSISIDEMAGGTFTISNGGVYGSLLSTPIINPPQSAILGMHSIVNRPMVVGGNVVPRPMMYIALTYDHRLIDGREAVFFLRRIKDIVEDPRRLLLDI
ncbi:hypothetical protein CUMW_174650 [Citrus unshiu]|uniref:Dihydrolipoamide acetyltransferase component of pyruvate dehydrogenase complex n=1 Tax=Citrus unshiu TaxID=55188 RepID=A0A2H5PWS4_CITUN|nr:hypothetical protein CUMW_174650 [Citrus unshiu]